MKLDRWPWLAALPVAVVAIAAGWQSYTHISDLATMTGQPHTDALLLPVVIDGLIVAGSVILLAGSWLGWLGVVPGIVATVFGNLMSAAGHGWLAGLVAAWPAAAFILATFMLERWLARRPSTTAAAAAVDELGAAADARTAVAGLVSAGIEKTQELAAIVGVSERHARRLRRAARQGRDKAADTVRPVADDQPRTLRELVRPPMAPAET
jgi:Protein of unknown function (DUF2637)